jgi:hypothetical protein
MLVDDENRFMTQRQFPLLALLQSRITELGVAVHHKRNGLNFTIPFEPATDSFVDVVIWDDVCAAQLVGEDADRWFSNILSFPCRLVYMPDRTERKIDTRYAGNNETTAFADAFPFLMIGQSSMDDLNARLSEKVAVNRFRPNIVFKGGQPYEEDEMARFTVHDIEFYGVKLCARCTIPAINQETAERGKEPSKTLAAYRKRGNNIYFGQNLLHKGEGVISVGDRIEILERNLAMKLSYNY